MILLLPISPSSEIYSYGGWAGERGRPAVKTAGRIQGFKDPSGFFLMISSVLSAISIRLRFIFFRSKMEFYMELALPGKSVSAFDVQSFIENSIYTLDPSNPRTLWAADSIDSITT